MFSTLINNDTKFLLYSWCAGILKSILKMYFLFKLFFKMPAHQEYNRNFVSSLIMMQEKHYVHEVVENIIRSAIPEDHWELIQYIYCDVEYKNIELKDLDYHILINTTFSKKKIDLVIKMYDIYIDEFNKIRDLQEKKRNVSRFVFIKFILNVESLFVNRQ